MCPSSSSVDTRPIGPGIAVATEEIVVNNYRAVRTPRTRTLASNSLSELLACSHFSSPRRKPIEGDAIDALATYKVGFSSRTWYSSGRIEAPASSESGHSRIAFLLRTSRHVIRLQMRGLADWLTHFAQSAQLSCSHLYSASSKIFICAPSVDRRITLIGHQKLCKYPGS